MTKSKTAGQAQHPGPLDHDADGKAGGSRPASERDKPLAVEAKEKPADPISGSGTQTSASAGATAEGSASGAPDGSEPTEPTLTPEGEVELADEEAELDAEADLQDEAEANRQKSLEASHAELGRVADLIMQADIGLPTCDEAHPAGMSAGDCVEQIIGRMKSAEEAAAIFGKQVDELRDELAARTPNPAAPEVDPEPPEPTPLFTPEGAALRAVAAQAYGLYLYPGKGYATHEGGPYHDTATIADLARAGMVYAEPSGGNHGSVKVTDLGKETVQSLSPA